VAGLDAFGTQLERSDMGGSPVFTAIANVSGFKGPKMKRDTADTTAHDSPNHYREFIGTLIDAGEITLDINYDPADHDALVSDFEDTAARNYKLTYPLSASEWAFAAWLTGFEADAPMDNKLAATVTIKLTGKPAITTPAP
jgi:hypothetical protein